LLSIGSATASRIIIVNYYPCPVYFIANKGVRGTFESSEARVESLSASNEVEYDHIFPKSKLEPFLKSKGVESAERKRTINEIANMALMTKQGKIITTNEDPASYFPKVSKRYEGEDLFNRQQIPYKEKLLSYENYDDSLSEQRN
jgi:hypothetical protein